MSSHLRMATIIQGEKKKKKTAAVTPVRQPPWTGTSGIYLKNSFSLPISIGPEFSGYLFLSS